MEPPAKRLSVMQSARTRYPQIAQSATRRESIVRLYRLAAQLERVDGRQGEISTGVVREAQADDHGSGLDRARHADLRKPCFPKRCGARWIFHMPIVLDSGEDGVQRRHIA